MYIKHVQFQTILYMCSDNANIKKFQLLRILRKVVPVRLITMTNNYE